MGKVPLEHTSAGPTSSYLHHQLSRSQHISDRGYYIAPAEHRGDDFDAFASRKTRNRLIRGDELSTRVLLGFTNLD